MCNQEQVEARVDYPLHTEDDPGRRPCHKARQANYRETADGRDAQVAQVRRTPSLLLGAGRAAIPTTAPTSLRTGGRSRPSMEPPVRLGSRTLNFFDHWPRGVRLGLLVPTSLYLKEHPVFTHVSSSARPFTASRWTPC